MLTILSQLARWTARVSGLIFVLLIAAEAIAHGVLDLRTQALSVHVQVAAMLVMGAGFLTGWWHELLGGALAIGGFVLFNAVELAVNDAIAGGALPLFAAPGVLFLAAAGLSQIGHPPSAGSPKPGGES